MSGTPCISICPFVYATYTVVYPCYWFTFVSALPAAEFLYYCCTEKKTHNFAAGCDGCLEQTTSDAVRENAPSARELMQLSWYSASAAIRSNTGCLAERVTKWWFWPSRGGEYSSVWLARITSANQWVRLSPSAALPSQRWQWVHRTAYNSPCVLHGGL